MQNLSVVQKLSGVSIYFKWVLFLGSQESLFNFQLFNGCKPNQSHNSVIGTAKSILARVTLAHMLCWHQRTGKSLKFVLAKPGRVVITKNPDGHAVVTCLYDVKSDSVVLTIKLWRKAVFIIAQDITCSRRNSKYNWTVSWENISIACDRNIFSWNGPHNVDSKVQVEPAHSCRLILILLSFHAFYSIPDSVSGYQRHWPECARAQAVLGLCCPHMRRRYLVSWQNPDEIPYEPEHSIFYKILCASSEDWDQSAHPNRPIRHFCSPPKDALDPWLPTECPTKTLVRLLGSAVWSESPLVTHAI